MKKATALLALMVFMITGTAFAAGATNATKGAGTTNATKHEGKSRPPKFEECDKDKDGSLTLEEFTACYPRSAEKFAAIDANSDGKVTKDEVKAHRAERKQERAAKHAGKNATKKEAPAQ